MCDHPFGNRRSRLRSQHRRLSSYSIIVRIPVSNLYEGLMVQKRKASAETTNHLTLLNNNELLMVEEKCTKATQ